MKYGGRTLAWVRARDPRWSLVVAWLLAMSYAYPGYMNYDAGEQIYQARTAIYSDWHPPVMAAYWRVVEVFVRGPLGLLLLQLPLFLWGVYAALRRRFSVRVAAFGASALLLFPPILTPMAPVWKDAQMAAFLIAGTMLAAGPGHARRIVGLVLLLLAAGVRDNGAAALPPLLLLIASSWLGHRWWRTAVAAFGLCVLLVGGATLANRLLTSVHTYPWYHSVAIHDVAGTVCNAGPMTDAEVRALTAGMELKATADLQRHMCRYYTPRVWFDLPFGPGPIFTASPDATERAARKAAWTRAVTEHTGAYLAHRWRVMQEVLGLTASGPWEPVCQTFGANRDHLYRVRHDASRSWIQRRLGNWFKDSWSTTWLYRPWVYALLSLVLAFYALVRRDGIVLALTTSGVLYEASFAFGTSAPDFRYSHWMITCTCLALAIVFGERLRDGLQRRRGAETRPTSAA